MSRTVTHSWRDATSTTITRIQRIFAIHPGLTLDQQLALYAQAHLCVAASGPESASQYWNTFVNVLRTLVVGLCPDADPSTSFD